MLWNANTQSKDTLAKTYYHTNHTYASNKLSRAHRAQITEIFYNNSPCSKSLLIKVFYTKTIPLGVNMIPCILLS